MHPADFAPVAPLTDECARGNTRVAAVSVDSTEDRRAWSADIAESRGHEVAFPSIEDMDREVSALYRPPVRSMLAIGPDKRTTPIRTYPARTGTRAGMPPL
ncbi:hypothetical protein ACKI1Q_39500 [Streptomyces galilaeus]|uniref:hypothetical protein n=1 Tax=Streptomyces galilaeus TaxID=33899 RepID=UPI0038F7E7B1